MFDACAQCDRAGPPCLPPVRWGVGKGDRRRAGADRRALTRLRRERDAVPVGADRTFDDPAGSGAVGLRARDELKAVVAVLAGGFADVDVLHGGAVELLRIGSAGVAVRDPDDDRPGDEIDPARERRATSARIGSRAHVTTTVPLMSSCPVPQNTSHRNVKVPALSAVKRTFATLPGITSVRTPKSGRLKPIGTSGAVSCSST